MEAEIVKIAGESYRRKEAMEREQQREKRRSKRRKGKK